MRRTHVALGLVAVLAAAVAGRRVLRGSTVAELAAPPPPEEAVVLAKRAEPKSPPAPPPPTLAGLDLAKARTEGGAVVAPLEDARTARLTIDPGLQKTTLAVMAHYKIPEASVVLMEVETGNVLVYASRLATGPWRDLCAEATAPAASVFKVVTGAALVESAGLGPDHRECFSGGEQRIHASDLERDPKRDRWCTTLAGALGRSLNTVFARLASEKLPPKTLETTARSLGFGAPIPFDVPVQASALELPDEKLAYARTAAGFWNTTLSPLHAAWLSATMARGGEPVRPHLVSEIKDASGKALWTAKTGEAERRAIEPRTAQAVTTMMETTVSEGTSHRAFHDARGQAFLPGIPVAGKTGTLTDAGAQRFYTWFTGFSTSRSHAEAGDGRKLPPRVAVAALVVNGPKWTVKANVVAREVLRAYYASRKVPSVSAPLLRAASQPSTTPATKHRRQRGS